MPDDPCVSSRRLPLDPTKLVLWVAQGKAAYQMSRGSFKTKDKTTQKNRLFYSHQEGNTYYYQNQQISLKVAVETTDYLTFNFEIHPDYNRFWMELPSDAGERMYGCGEQFTEFNLKGKKAVIWVSEHHSVKKILKKFLREKLLGVNPDHKGRFSEQQTYYAQPTFLSSKCYFLHVDSTQYGFFDFQKKKTILHFREVPKRIIIGEADSFLQLSSKLANYLGKHPVLPDWTSQGAIIASQGGIENAQLKLQKAKEARVNVVGIWSQDWSGQLITKFGSQVYWNWQVDETLYPRLKTMIAKWNAESVRFLGYINTFLKENTPLYLEAKTLDYLVKRQDNTPYHIKSTTFEAGIVDLTNPNAFEWYKEIIKTNMIDLGMSGWMADFGEYLPTDAVIHCGAAESKHNEWPALWARLNYEAIREKGKLNELFFFTRAGFTETVRYTPTMWAGDQHVDFSDEYGLPSAICSTLSLSTIGIGLNHSDIGGYTTILHMKRSPELFMRWAEMNLFTPLFRCHEGNRPESNCQFDSNPEVLRHFAKMSQYYNGLSPYLESCKAAYYETGVPVNRPLFFHYQEPFCFETKRQFMEGPDLLVAPVTRANRTTVRVFLPQDEWIHLFTKKVYSGGMHEVEAPIGQPNAFYRKNSAMKVLFDSITIIE